MARETRYGLALGGGGAKGLAHVPLLAALEEAGIRPSVIAGTSIGAIVATLYAAGIRAADVREALDALTRIPQSLQEVLGTRQLLGWLDYIGIDIGRNSFLNVDRFLEELESTIGVNRFEDLEIPLKVVATDFWAREEVVFDSGPLIPAVAASFALPGIFKPVVQDGRVLIDGGSVNPLPYDLLLDECDVVIAIDVLGKRAPKDDLVPSYTETLFNTFQIAEKAILNAKFRMRRPDVYVEVAIQDVRVLEFHKAQEIYRQTESAAKELIRKLGELKA